MTERFPWYDSWFLTSYVRARDHLRLNAPGRADEFERAFDVLRVRPDFETLHVNDLLTATELRWLQELVARYRDDQLEQHELAHFGRYVVHRHLAITSIQHRLVERVSELVGEPVEPSYNFLCFYRDAGICPPHMDSPDAKWTVDVCLSQSAPWPIEISGVVPWPADESFEDGWADRKRQDPAMRYESIEMEPGEALVFGGSSQWHHRDAQPGEDPKHCELLFFHFIPRGTEALLHPDLWHETLAIPELADLALEPSPGAS